MGGSKKSRATIPEAPPPSPTPTQLDEEFLAKERARRRQRLRARGRAGTILTEGGLGEPEKKASLLGGAA